MISLKMASSSRSVWSGWIDSAWRTCNQSERASSTEVEGVEVINIYIKYLEDSKMRPEAEGVVGTVVEDRRRVTEGKCIEGRLTAAEEEEGMSVEDSLVEGWD